MSNLMLLTDGYKLDHRRQYPEGTEYVLSNFTPRSSRVPGVDEVVFFGLQYFLKRYFEKAKTGFFMGSSPGFRSTFKRTMRDLHEESYEEFLKSYFGPEAAKAIGTKHIGDLYDLGYMPLRFCALPEGTRTPLRVPMFTVENTHPDFFWLTNYFETLISSVIWPMCTSATTAYGYRKLFDEHARKTGGSNDFVPWQGHDFSFRGMEGPEAAGVSGAGHLLSFSGTDNIPGITLLKDYYGANGTIGGSVPATEHAVMCAGGKESELETFRRLLKLYPTGILSVVSDTWDFWKVVTEILPKLKNEIMARDGKLVIRPDSGDPVDILCGNNHGYYNKTYRSPTAVERAGLVETLAKIFGTTTNEKGFLELDSHIGCIYGDSITYDRAESICSRLASKGFSSTNWVAGIGSYTYQYVTRDTYGFAMKATWAQVNGTPRALFKDPKTDDGTKKSAKGRVAVVKEEGKLVLLDGWNYKDTVDRLCPKNRLKTVWEDGKFLQETTFDQIKGVLHS